MAKTKGTSTIPEEIIYNVEDLLKARARSKYPLWSLLSDESLVNLGVCCHRCGIDFFILAKHVMRGNAHEDF